MNKVQTIFKHVFNIQPDEFKLVQSFFLYYTCLGMFITISFTVGDSLFLTHVRPEKVNSLYAWGHVGIAITTVALTWLYNRVMDLVSRITRLIGTQFILLLSIFVFRQLIPSDSTQASEWLYFGLVIWLRVCSRLSIMLFFSFAGDYFTTHDAKRLYSYIAGGLAVGDIVAGILIRQIVSIIGSANMLYICMGFLAAGIGFSLFIHKIGTPVTQPGNSSDTETKTKISLKEIISQSYIGLVFLVVLIGLMCFVIVDFQMKIVAKNSYPSSTDLAIFFGNFYMYAGMMKILFQFLVVEFLLRQLGIINCLMILPAIHAIMSLVFYSTGYGFFAGYTLLIIASANFFRIILSDSLDLPSRELLFLPLPPSIRVRAQAIMGGMIIPFGQGISGLLIISLSTFGMLLFQYSLFVLFFALGGISILLLLRPRYRDILVSSLKNNQLDATELQNMVQGADRDFVLEELLTSDDEQVVSVTLDLLRDRQPGGLAMQLRDIATGSKPVIAARAIEILSVGGDTDHLDTIDRTLTSTSDVVREAALLAFCRIKKEKALERVRQWVKSPDQLTRNTAIVGCGRYCGREGTELTQPILKQMVSSHAPEERSRAARLLHDIRNPVHASLVKDLLDDPDINVCIAAVEASGAIRIPALVPHLLQLYRVTEMRGYVIEALEQMPEECIPMISEAAHDPNLNETPRTLLFQVLAFIGGISAQKSLWEVFSGNTPLIIRVAAGSALQWMVSYNRLQEVDEIEFDMSLKQLCERIDLLNQTCKEIDGHDKFVWQLLHDHARIEIECLFQLLTFRYNVNQIEKVRYNFFYPGMIQRANALELLDDILPRRIAPGIVQLLDAFVKRTTIDGKGLSESTAQQLMGTETWLRVVSTYHLNRRTGNFTSLTQVGESLTESEKTIYNLLEKISFLKKVPLFKDVPGNYLISLAKVVHLVNIKDKEPLFHQGQRGDAMYLIRHGSISIQIDSLEVKRARTGDCIGEMSILDNTLRSASCVATEDSELLRISARDFETVVRSQTSVALAMLQTLSEHLRQQTIHTMKQIEIWDTLHGKEKNIAQQSITSETWKKEVSTYHRNSGTDDPDTRTEKLPAKSTEALHKLFERISFLKRIPLFQEIPENYLIPLAKIVHSIELRRGETLFKQGAYGDAMYLICDGKISVQVDGIEVNRVGAGECIGEMSLLDSSPRSASCIAKENTELLRIADRNFETIIKSQSSFALAILRTLAKRLRDQNSQHSKNRSKNSK